MWNIYSKYNMIGTNINQQSIQISFENETTLDPMKVLQYCGVKPGMNLADLGCGPNGYFAIPMAKMTGPGSKVYAIDIIKSSLESLKSKADLVGLSNIITIWSNLEKVGAANVPRGTIEMCFIVNTLYQSNQHREILVETASLLKPNGKIVIIDWDKNTGGGGPLEYQRASKDDLKKLASELSLKPIKEFMASKYHFGLILDKIVS